MCKRGGLLIAYDIPARRALVTDADCDSWKCAECAERMSAAWVMRAEIGARRLIDAGARVDFATLTSHERLKDFRSTAEVFPSAWDKLHKRLNRQSDTREYLMIPERHKDGRLHVHALWTFGVSRRWLKDNARACGLGYQADVKPVREAFHAVKYVTKYVGKALGDDAPAHFRRVRVSAGWADIPAPDVETSDLDWHYIGGNGALNAAYDECDRLNLTLIDVRTGEIFDDIDMGTIAWGN